MSKEGVCIDVSTHTVFITGQDLIHLLLGKLDNPTLIHFNAVAVQIVELIGHEFNVVVGDEPEKWCLGSDNIDDMNFINSYLSNSTGTEVVTWINGQDIGTVDQLKQVKH